MFKLLNYQSSNTKCKIIKYKYYDNLINGNIDKCQDHVYSPYIKGGSCRICYGYNKSEKDILFEILKSI